MRILHLRATIIAAIILIFSGNVLLAGSLTNISVDPSDNEAGAEVIYTFTFTTSSTGVIPDNGKIEFIFPSGFNVSNVEIVQSKNLNMNGGFSSIGIYGQIVRVTRDGAGTNVPGSTEVSIAIGMVGNHASAGAYNTEIRTLTQSLSIIDTGSTPNFNIIPGSLHHFQVVTSGNATAGSNFSITITAQDAYNNTITSFTNEATLNDKTGTILPTITGSFVSGQWSGNIIFTKSYTNNQVTVTYDNKSGNSAVFNVLPDGLDHFTFDTISSPQVAGNSFGIVITAEDQFNNTVTSFTDQVLLTDNSSALNSTSNNFVSGMLTQNVSITISQPDNYITANHIGSGKSGTSNFFNVNSSSLSKFYIDPISSSQTSGEWFSVTVTAQDEYDNTVVNFSNTVDISDLSNSITPLQSGNFSSGKWSGSVKISSAYNNDQITVIRTGGAEEGSSNTFNVAFGSLDHFTISIVSSQTAGNPFSITITAKDKEANTISSFSGPVAISDLTGTIQPSSSGIFSNGVRTESITITGVKQNNQIIVTGDGKNGNSNSFDVNPNILDHFTFTNITSPQTAGQEFSTTIEAMDQYENKVTNFNSSVTLSDNTGSLTPTSSGNFISGSKSVNVTITKKWSDNQITANDPSSGKRGNSNRFNIAAGLIQNIIIRNNPGGLGNEAGNLSLNLNDQVTFHAAGYDQWNNYVRDVISDWGKTGTLDTPSPLNSTSTTFISTTPQTSGQIYADSSGMRDYTGTITVGNIHHVLIRDAAAGGGNVIDTKSITADDTLRLYAAAYDEGDNYLGAVIVDWSSNGSLQPAISSPGMSSINFVPTAAPASGQIVADHQTAQDYTTGTITVNPGAPVGNIVLHPKPKSIPAHPDSFSIISSDMIYDNDGNPIAEGELFTVSTTLGTITAPLDQAIDILGHQVVSNWSSQITFTINGESIGGSAIIHANSVGKGSAFGDTTLTISNIHIVSIHSIHSKVSQGQNSVLVGMTIKNRGTENLIIPNDGAALRFNDSFNINRSGEYTVARTDTFSVLQSNGGQKILTFNVNVSPSAATDSITIDGNINGIVNGMVVSDTTADQIHKWMVQTPPGLRIERIEASADTVVQGKMSIVNMTIRNDGDASFVIDSDSLTFWAVTQSKNVTHEYSQFPTPSNPDTIAGHSSELLTYSVQVGSAATIDTIVVNAKVSGRDVNTNLTYNDYNANFVDGWRVKLASDVLIPKFLPDQMSVTSGQDRDWKINMAVSNSGGSDLKLDSAKVKFTIGAFDISSQYLVLSPTSFRSRESDTLGAGQIDTLQFTIDETGATLGTITIEGIVYLNDMVSGQIIKNAFTGVIVQSPAQIKIDYLRTSQSEVTVSQAFPWKTIIALTNNGGSAVLIDTTQIRTFVSFLGDPDFVVMIPTGFYNSGNYFLNAGASDSLFFTIDTTGKLAGNRQINANVIAKEINSDRIITVQKTTSIQVEQPANIRIAETIAVAPNAPYVDSDQSFQLAVVVENLGQDAARDVAIELKTDSLSTILNPIDTLNTIFGGQSDTAKFNLKAYSGWIISEVFAAQIDTAFAENTPEPDKILMNPAIDSIDTITVQRPAKMKILSVVPSKDTVRALIYDEWQIRIAVQDSGAGFIELDQPTENDVSILMEGEAQKDYTIIPPTGFKNSQNLTLSWWESDTLIYRIARTGIRSGLGRIKVHLDGTYLNTGIPFETADSAAIYIQPSADVFIDITEPVCPNINQYDIGQVNTNQSFIIKSKIRNAGGERVDDVVVSLTAPGYSTTSDTVAYISQAGFAWANFNISAQPTPAEQVNFITKIESAISHEGGLPATIGPASDSVASVRVHQPALLKLSTNRADSIFSIGKLGALRVKVENLGTAEVDSSGEISVEMPDGYYVVVNEQQKSADTIGFKIDEQIFWQINPPQYTSFNDTIVVEISKPPKDKNTNSFASIVNTDPFDTLIVKTVPSMLSINSFKITAPAGAMDDTLSTFQDFWVQVDVNASENIDSLWASLVLPEGYGFGVGFDSVKTIVNNRANWKLKASEIAHPVPKLIKVVVFGTTGYEIQMDGDSIAVITEKRASLSIRNVQITWPKTDTTLSAGQLFDLQVFVVNNGKANIDGSAHLKINFGATGVTAVQQDTIKPFVPGIPTIWKLKAPEAATASAPIVVSLDTIPNDENTNLPVNSENDIEYFWVNTQNAGTASIDSLWIKSPSGAIDKILSTHQNFTVEADVRWYNTTSKPSISLQLEEGFTTVESNPKTPTGTEQQGRVSWTIKAPEDSKQGTNIWLELSAEDEGSLKEFSVVSDSLQVDVVNRSEVQLNSNIISPKSAIDRVVSTSQKFVVGAFVSNSGDAGLTGNYSATIVAPEGYVLLGYHTQTTKCDDTLYWEIESPNFRKEAKNITVQLVSNPKDENTSVPVAAEAILQGGVVSIPIQTEEKSVVISTFSPRNKYTITRGDTSVAMLGLELSCSGDANSNNILFSGVKVKLKDRLGNLILNPGSVISRIAVVKYTESSLVYGQITNIPASQPMEILFSKIDTLKPEIANRITFQVDVVANTKISDFKLAIDSTNALYLVDEESHQAPKLKDENGQNLKVLDFTSNSTVIIESDFNEAFRNFPNPFGIPSRPFTKFIYYLDQDTDVNIKIYTLIGELVWSRSYSSNDPQGKKGSHEGDIFWDGRNDKGYKVLNGVYIARISTGYGKSALTKIAIIK